jgi:hypothetical protein
MTNIIEKAEDYVSCAMISMKVLRDKLSEAGKLGEAILAELAFIGRNISW